MSNKCNLSLGQGNRFDGKNHNWLILQEYLALPFSYMSFVIKGKIEENCQKAQMNIFDPTPYNYIFNKSSSFLDGDFVQFDHNKLNDILEGLNEVDPVLLEILQIQQEQWRIKGKRVDYDPTTGKHDIIEKKYITALHLALRAGNNRSIEIILNFLAKIPYNSSKNISDIMP